MACLVGSWAIGLVIGVGLIWWTAGGCLAGWIDQVGGWVGW